jgi:hypothetical protein
MIVQGDLKNPATTQWQKNILNIFSKFLGVKQPCKKLSFVLPSLPKNFLFSVPLPKKINGPPLRKFAIALICLGALCFYPNIIFGATMAQWQKYSMSIQKPNQHFLQMFG